MSADCCEIPAERPGLRRVLWIALILNSLMFFLEIGYGWFAESAALKADAVDFFGDAVNYGLSLFVLSSALAVRARASLIKASMMGLFGVGVLGNAFVNLVSGSSPHGSTMSSIGILALAVNVGVAVLLFKFREGDSNIQSVWLCSRNDAIGNIAVILAGLGVSYFSANWPDLAVAILISVLNVTSAVRVFQLAIKEKKHVHNIP